MNCDILFAKKKFSCFIFIAQTKMSYSTVSKTRAGDQECLSLFNNFPTKSILIPPIMRQNNDALYVYWQ